MKVHLSGVCGTAMASLAGLLRERGHEVTGSDQDVYPPMSTQLEALGIADPLALRRGQRARGRRPGGDRQRALARQPRGRGGPRPQAAHDQPARARWPRSSCATAPRSWWPARTARPRPRACSPSCWSAAGLDPSFLSAACPHDFGRQLPPRAGAPLRDRGRRVRLRVLRQAAEVRALPARTSRSSATSSTTTPTSTPTWPRCRRRSCGCCSVVPRRGLRGRGRSRARRSRRSCRGACCRVETFGLAAGADWRAADVRPRGRADALPAARRGGRDQGELQLPLAGDHNVRNALAALARGRGAPASPPAAVPRRPCRDFRGVKRRLEVRGHGRAGSRSTTTSRTTRRRCARPSRRCAPRVRATPRPAAGRGLRAALVHVAHACLPGRLRVARSPLADRVIVAGRAPAGQGAGRAAALRGGARGGDPRPAGTAPTSCPRSTAIVSAARGGAAGGRPGGDPLERRLRRDPREAARGPAALAPASELAVQKPPPRRYELCHRLRSMHPSRAAFGR